jgi:hypothetical protein
VEPGPTRVEEVHLYLPSADLGASRTFYADGLLFTRLVDVPEMCTLRLDRLFLSFVPGDAGRFRAPAGAGWLFAVDVDDIHTYYERVRATRRVRFEQELELMMPGVWQFSVMDNNGYHVGFSAPNRPGPAAAADARSPER